MSTARDLATTQLNDWTDTLTSCAEEPLSKCPDFPAIAARHEAWWAHSLQDRPLFLAAANTRPDRPITRNLELLDQPAQWLRAKLAEVEQLHYVGDALPAIRVDFGPILLAGLLGGQREIGSNTAWTRAFIDDDWSNAPDWAIAPDHPLWLRVRKLAQLAAESAAGYCLVGTPDLGNCGDILLTLRGANGLCMDAITQPGTIRSAVTAMIPNWHQFFMDLHQEILSRGAGLIHWLGLWSNRPYDVSACDFNAMIGPQSFKDLFLPAIVEQAAAVGRAVFHLDGPDAARHIDLLLDVPEIHAIQFSPGAGSPSALPWIDMFHKIQRRGRSILVFCRAHEVTALCQALKPEGLAIKVHESMTPSDLDALYVRFHQMF